MYLRQQTVIYMDDLNVDFMELFVDTWNRLGVDAGRCAAIGA